MENVDRAEDLFRDLRIEVEKSIDKISSEEDAKVQIIFRIFSEVLGWNYSGMRCEESHDSGFSDLILYINDKPQLLIEAKRIGLVDIRTSDESNVRYLKLSGSSLKKCVDGVKQAASYAHPNGLPMAILTDGIAWIFFKPFVQNENYLDKEAIVFPSLSAIENNFSIFYELASKTCYENKLFSIQFDKLHNKRLLLNRHLTTPMPESEARMLPRSGLAFDLEPIFSQYFSAIANDDELILECFVESRESKIAEFSIEKMALSLVGKISERNVEEQLADLIDNSVEVDEELDDGQSVFIVGSTGAGKSTFLKRFFKTTLESSIAKQCLIVNVNFLDATGDEGTVLEWARETTIKSIEEQIYEDGSPEWNDLLGLYHSEYVRRSKGTGSVLYRKDRDKFLQEFGEFLAEKVEKDREGYLRRILNDVVRNRKLLPILIIDNTDEYDLSYKTKLFQYAQSLRRHAKHCLVIFPATDKSAWSFSKTDIFGIYESRTFFLPTPSPREVFRKRINYLKKNILKYESKGNSRKYVTSRGINISIADINGFANVVEDVFVSHDFTSKTIGQISNYNIRRTLLLAQRVITSAVFKIEDLIKSYVGGEPISTDFSKFMEALVKGNYEIYRRGDAQEIFPLFDVSTEIRQSPLTNIRILALLKSIKGSGKSIDEQHLSIGSLVDFFLAIGGDEISIEHSIKNLLESGLIEPFDSSNYTISNSQRLAISNRGSVHLNLGSKNSVYFFQMALTTPILDDLLAERIRSEFKSNSAFSDKLSRVKSLFLEYLIQQDSSFFNTDIDRDEYISQRDLISDLENFANRKLGSSYELPETLGRNFQEGAIIESVLGVVKFFDYKKNHFGMLEVPEIDAEVYISHHKIREFGLEVIVEGESILCDLARDKKGFHVSKVHDIELNSSDAIMAACVVEKYFADRGYGFASVSGTSRTAYFSSELFDEGVRSSLKNGYSFNAELVVHKSSEMFAVRKITPL